MPMNLTIVGVKNRGDEKEEYICLKVTADASLKNYIVSDSTYTSGGKISNRLRHIFWFYPVNVKAGDFVWLYTKAGLDRNFSNTSKTTTYEFYWGLARPIWNDDKDCAILFELNTWEVKPVTG